jgi:hypothetical protein
LAGGNDRRRGDTTFFGFNRCYGEWRNSIYGGGNVMNTEKEYMKIGKAIIDECMERGNERCITITLRSVQFDGKLYIRMEDRVEPMSTWKYEDLQAVSLANRQQGARERADEIAKKIRVTPIPVGFPRVVIVK